MEDHLNSVRNKMACKIPIYDIKKKKKKEPSFRSLGVILLADRQTNRQTDVGCQLTSLPPVKVVTTRTGWAAAAPSLL